MSDKYKAALEALGKGDSVLYDSEGFAYGVDIEHTIRHALKLADKVTGEPSVGMESEWLKVWRSTRRLLPAHKAMIAKAQKEIEDDQ
jgi:hypothetical protein